MTFYSYMTRNYLALTGPKGDLARDMKSEKDKFPKNGNGKFKGWHDILYQYFLANGACRECLNTFEDSWKEYIECERKRLKKHL